jgi:prepilin-type N-terminal cleavage/methylation domain-containing protein
MKLTRQSHQSGFTLAEILTAMAIAVVIFAAIITASLAMQKSFNAVDHYFATQIQQIRIIDYLNRDVKRALSVITSADQQTVTLTIPNYIIQCGDADADATCTGTPPTAPTGSNIGKPRTPTANNSQVNYGTTVSTVVYSISGNSILRTEDPKSDGHPALTTIASSTDQLVPSTADMDLINTECATMAVTFKPIFTSGNVADERTGTTVFSLAYLRNKRRG